MSTYFRLAAKCDRSVALTAPVELYALPPEEPSPTPSSSTPAQVTQPHVASLDNQPEADDSTDAVPLAERMLTNPQDRVRAALDSRHAQDVRLNLLREANVLRKDRLHESKVERRMREIQERNEWLLEEHRREKKRLQEEEEAQRRKEEEAKRLSLKKQFQSALEDDSSSQEKRDPFELLRIEERRLLQHYNTSGFQTSSISMQQGKSRQTAGGIIGLYNEASLDTVFDEKGAPKPSQVVGSTLFPIEVQAPPAVAAVPDRSGISATKPNGHQASGLSSLIIPTDVTLLQKSGYGADVAAERLQRLREEQLRLKSLTQEIKHVEGSEKTENRNRERTLDKERQAVLLEVVVQDNERRHRKAAEKELQRQEVEAEAAFRRERAEHPIDLYHKAIREDIIGDKSLQEGEKVRREMSKLLSM